MAKRAVYISSLLAVPQRMRELAEGDEQVDEWASFLRAGERYRDAYLDVAHGGDNTSRDAAPAFAQFRASADAWEARALSVARRLRLEDHDWQTTWPGPSYRAQSAVADLDTQTDVPALAPTPEPPNADVGGAAVPSPGRRRARPSNSQTPRQGPWEPVRVRHRPAGPALPSQVDKPVSAPPCIFCAAATDTAGYLWPDWICRYFAERNATWTRAEGTRDGVVERLRREVDRTVDRVCPSCLHGWIQRLDDDVIAFLPGMIAGDKARLTPRQQALLARWGAKMAAVLECLYGEPATAARAAYACLRSGDLHPGTQVLIGQYNGSARVLAHDRDAFRRTVDGAEHLLPQSTFVIGNVFMQVFADPWRDSTPDSSDGGSQLLIALVPRRRRKVQWPPAVAIDDARYDSARRGELDDSSDTFDGAQSITA